MNRYDEKGINYLISKPRGLFLARRRQSLRRAKAGNDYHRYYYLKDRLSNNRIVMNASGAVVQMTNYYPSGTTIAESPARSDQGIQPYKFGSKELDRSHGLDFYDFEARQFDPVLMRFTRPDPLQEKYYSISPYAYALNNPVNTIDPDGRDPIILGGPALSKGMNRVVSFFANNSDLQDAFVLITTLFEPITGKPASTFELGVNEAGILTFNYAPASSEDIEAAQRGAILPVVSGSAVKNTEKAVTKTFNGGNDTANKTSREALRNAKDQNGVPRSQQPDKTIKPNTPEGSKAGLDSRNVKQYEYTNSKGEKVIVRQDKAATYKDAGSQPEHYNAGKDKKLDQHHNY